MFPASFKRWLYRGDRPNWLARALNRWWAIIAATGATAQFGMVTLEVTGRATGRVISLPIAVVVVAGQRYLVSMLGENVQWVKNVRASGGQATLVRGRREVVRLAEVPAAQRAPILRAYLRLAPGARPHIPVPKDAPLHDFERVAADYPVFLVTPARADEAGPARERAARESSGPARVL